MANIRRKSAPQAMSKPSNMAARPVTSERRVRLEPAASTRKAPVMPARRVAKTVAKAVSKASTKAALKAAKKPAKKAATRLRPESAIRSVAPPPTPPVRRSTYAEAVALYQRGIEALQSHRYREAAELLNSVVARYPEEKELHERAFLYLRVCERQIAAAPPRPETPEERTLAATLAINNGTPDQAIAILATLIADDPENDQATYMLGVANALKGRPDVALQYLSLAMALNPENRSVARKDPDLELLRRTDDMRLLLASPPAPLPRKDKRTPSRGKGR
jgi:tetratricopeptide (TPR) repeat protein